MQKSSAGQPASLVSKKSAARAVAKRAQKEEGEQKQANTKDEGELVRMCVHACVYVRACFCVLLSSQQNAARAAATNDYAEKQGRHRQRQR